MTELLLIRHGEVDPEVVGTHYGDLDVALSERGRAQSDEVARRLATASVDAVWSSELRRAKELAERIAAPHGLAVQTHTDLRERHVGGAQGMTYAAAEEAFPGHPGLAPHGDGIARPPRGESLLDLAARVLPVIASIAAAHPDQRVAIAAHGGPIRVVLGHVLGVPLENLPRLRIAHCAISTIELRPGRPGRVLRINAADA